MIKMREEFAIRFNDEYLRETYNRTNVFSFSQFAWDKLPDKVKAAAIMLGYDEYAWDYEKDIPAYHRSLTADEVRAVEILGLQKLFNLSSSLWIS